MTLRGRDDRTAHAAFEKQKIDWSIPWRTPQTMQANA